MVSEEQLLSQLHQAFPGDDYIFQVIKQDAFIEIYLNYKGDLSPSPPEIALDIETAIAGFDWSQIKQIYLLGRALGVTDPEWDIQLKLGTEQSSDNGPEIHADASASDSASNTHPSLSDYCFTRNKALLTTEILPPSEAVAQLIQQFSELTSAHQQSLLPDLDAFFRGKGKISSSEEAVQAWVEAYSALSQSERRKATIWLSRYCAAPEKTVVEIQAVLDPGATPSPRPESETYESGPSEDPEVQTTTLPITHSTDARTDDLSSRLAQPSSSTPPSQPSTPTPSFTIESQDPIEETQPRSKLLRLLPVIWAVCTFLLVVHDVRTFQASGALSQLCEGSQSSAKICRLTGELIGEKKFESVIEAGKSFSLPEVSDFAPPIFDDIVQLEGQETLAQLRAVDDEFETAVVEECFSFSKFYTGHFGSETQELQTPDLEKSFVQTVKAVQTDQVKPGVFLLRIQAPHMETNQDITTACAIAADSEDMSLIYSDIIPNDWPIAAYRRSDGTDLPQTSISLSRLTRLGTGTLFSGLGLLCAVFFGLAIRVNTLNALYKAALVLGLIEALLMLPILGGSVLFLVTGIVVGGIGISLTLGVASSFIKGLELDWGAGSMLVLSGSLAIIAVKKILYLLLLYVMQLLMSLG